MTISRRLLLSVAIGVALILGGLLLYRETLTEVTFDIDGYVFSERVRAETVAEALAEVDVLVESADQVEPQRKTELAENVTIQVTKAAQVAIEVDNRVMRFYTHSDDPFAILDEANIMLGTWDEITVDGIRGNSYPVGNRPPRIIRVLRANEITIVDGLTSQTIMTTAETVGGALRNAELALFVADDVHPSLGTAIEHGMTIEISRAVPVTVLVDAQEIHTRAQGNTIADILADVGITLAEQDYTVPSENMPIQPEMRIRVVRVTDTLEIIETPIAYETVIRPDATMQLDEQRLLQTGQNGLREERIRVRYEDGREVSRYSLGIWDKEPALDEVILYGTKVTRDTVPNTNEEYWRMLPMSVGAYSAQVGGTERQNPRSNTTSLGGTIREGVVAVDPTVIPLGTAVYIEGYGRAIASDALREGSGARILLGYREATLQPWSGSVEVYILAPVPPEIPYFVTLDNELVGVSP